MRAQPTVTSARTWIALLVGTLLLASAAGASGTAHASPAPPDPGGPATSLIAAPRDRTDRQWPRKPPWDACPRPVWPGMLSTGAPGQGRRVLIIGDSLTRESRVRTARMMRASGWTPTFRCWGSRRLDWGLDQVARARELGNLPGFVIVALGTNDISWETQQTTERRLETLLHRLGPKRHVLWVDLHLTRSAWLNARADWFNDLIRREARTHRNLEVVSWHRVARANGIRGWDGIHYGPSGYRLRARTVVAALNAEGRRHPAPSASTDLSSSAVPAPTPTPTPAATPSASPEAPSGAGVAPVPPPSGAPTA